MAHSYSCSSFGDPCWRSADTVRHRVATIIDDLIDLTADSVGHRVATIIDDLIVLGEFAGTTFLYKATGGNIQYS
ncbi:hypothetical protein J6590_028145 [Homalodisca vitripennis]|nr:hypothetical protein J6590_028145 [Homalodisca vitripennis]